MTFRKQLFTLAMCAATFFSGCGGPSDGNPDDQGTPVDECALNTDSCSPNATCTDTAAAFTCACRVGFTGNGVDCERIPCDDVSDCDDEVPCTVDSCTASGSCLHAPTSSLCSDSAVCHPTDGCTVGRICGSPSECVDNDPCTQDEMCDAATATCVFAPLDNDDDGEVPLVCGGTDCNDAARLVGASRGEMCGNGVDDNCNDVIDEDANADSDPRLRSDERNCGACGNECATGTTCYQGACVACGDAGEACCNAVCQSATSCSGGTCNNGGNCERNGGTATCAAAPTCGEMGQACCTGVGNSCSEGNVCGTDGTCHQVGYCSDAGTFTVYRLNTLNIPTSAQASGGATIGHNIDGVGTTCGVPDYAGGVDNSLIDLNEALPSLTPDDPIDLQEQINTALNCPTSSQSCTRLDLLVSIARGTGCLVIEILDADGDSLTEPFVAQLNVSGAFRGQALSFKLPLPYTTAVGTAVLDLEIDFLVITGNLSTNALTNVVIGGMLRKAPLEATIMESFIPLLDGELVFQDVGNILANLYDVQSSAQCNSLSVGFTASGTLVP